MVPSTALKLRKIIQTEGEAIVQVLDDMSMLIPSEVIPPPVSLHANMLQLDPGPHVVGSQSRISGTICPDASCSDEVVQRLKILRRVNLSWDQWLGWSR